MASSSRPVDPPRLGARRVRLVLVLSMPILAVLGGAVVWGELIPGVASWDNTLGALLAAPRLAGPAVAGLGVWLAFRERRRPRLGYPLLGLTLVTVGAYAAVATTVVTATAWQHPVGRPLPLGIAAGGAALLCHGVVGYLAGWALAGRLAATPRPPRWQVALAVAVTVATLAAVTMLTRVHVWWRLLLPATDPPRSVYACWRPHLVTARLTWYVGVAAALVAAHLLARRRRRLLVLPLVAGLALSGVSAARIHAYAGRPLTREIAVRPACRAWPLTVCVHPALRAGIPLLEAAITPIAARLAGTPGEFTRLDQRPEWVATSPPPRTRWIHLSDLAPGFEERAARQVVNGLLDTDACARADPTAARLTTDVADWLLGREATDAEGRWLVTQDQVVARSWLLAHYREFRTCRLAPADFG